MNILSVDSSGVILSIALNNGNKIIEKSFNSSKENSEKLLSEIKSLVSKSSLNFTDINGIAFCAGPGSFTGIRVGCGIAFGLAYAHNIPVIGINSFEALAAKFSKKNTICCIDARMSQIYVAAYVQSSSKLSLIGNMQVCDPDNLPFYDLEKPLIIGSAVKNYKNILEEKYESLNPEYDEINYSLASVIGKLAFNRFQKQFDTKHAYPIYIRDKVAQTIKERNLK